jgi:23S rRNA G2445 N2-methylase RlmL
MYNKKIEDSTIGKQLYKKMIHKYHEQLKNWNNVFH